MIGFLDLEGKFYPCNSYGHITKAAEIVEERGFIKTEKEFLDEDVLLNRGFICIRARDAFKGIYGLDRKILFISEAQQAFLKENWEKFNDNQKASLEGLLRDFGKLYEWHKEDAG